MQQSVIWLNGNLLPWHEATIHVATHTLHYGSGAFEGIRCYATDKGPAIFKLSDHIKRLLQSFSCFGVPFPWSEQELQQAVIDTVKANKLTSCYLRPLIFFGSESLVLSPKKVSVHCAIIALTMDTYLDQQAINVGISTIKRIHPESMPIHNKINGFYVNSIFAFHETQERGLDEALLLDHEGTIAEGSVANIFFVINGVLKTPPSSAILPGITRSCLLTIAQSLGISTRQEPVSLNDMANATEAFFCGTAREITPIKSIEHKQFQLPGSITTMLQQAYHTSVYGRDSSFKSWLTFVN